MSAGRVCRRSAGARTLLQDGPVERVVELVVEGAEEDAEELTQVHVVGRFLEAQTAAVVQVHGELSGEALRTQQLTSTSDGAGG